MKKWMVLFVIALIGVSLLFMVGCDGAGTDADKETNVDDTANTAATADGGDLVGTVWNLAAMNGTPLASDITTTIEFKDDGMYYAQAPVNTVRGPFTAGADGTLTLGPGAMTQMAGIDEAHNVAEKTFTDLLGQVVSYRVQGDTLSLLDDAGTVVLEFAK